MPNSFKESLKDRFWTFLVLLPERLQNLKVFIQEKIIEPCANICQIIIDKLVDLILDGTFKPQNIKSSAVNGVQGAVHKLDSYLWHKGIHDVRLRVMARFQVICVLSLFFCALLLMPLSFWPLWFAIGYIVFANIFLGLAKHLLSLRLDSYHFGLLAGVLLRSTVRFAITAVVLYMCLVEWDAPAMVIVGGMCASMAVAFGTFALVGFAGRN